MTLKERTNSPLYGLVLAGGKSSRMKTPKAHWGLENSPQWQVAQKALLPLCEKVFFSVSPQLAVPIPQDPALIIHDIFSEPCGPLGGIISACKKMPHAAFFVLACDMPWFSAKAALWLRESRNVNKLATVFENKNASLEPLCGIYEPAILPHLLRNWSEDRWCPRAILSELDVERVLPEDEKWLININSAADLEGVLPRAFPKSDKKHITVQFYASLRQQTKHANIQFASQAQTLRELFTELSEKYSLSINPQTLRYAKNDRLVPSSEIFEDGDTIVFIPPVSGG